MADSLLQTGCLDAGPSNTICDVSGVNVGHCTIDNGGIQTGVTVIVPPSPDLFVQKVPAGLCVINGFGKSVGLIQLQELGQIETPIALTNTFSVCDVAKVQIQNAIAKNREIGRAQSTVNPLVLECNDGFLNDIQAMAVRSEHYQHAFNTASSRFEQGSVGAGRGMSCFGLKGGIGSASRVVGGEGGRYMLGALVLANFGRSSQLVFKGHALGHRLDQQLAGTNNNHSWDKAEKGSIIIILATDAPIDARQLSRLSKRGAAGLARTGSAYGHGSGDIVLAFSTAYTVAAEKSQQQEIPRLLHETELDLLFDAAVEATENAILNALWHATPVVGRDGHYRKALRNLELDWDMLLR